MKKIKILITDPIDTTGVKMLEDNGYTITQKSDLNKEELLKIAGDYEAIICCSSTPIDREVMESAKKLKCIAITSTGWDTIDIKTADRLKIAVFGQPANSKGGDISREGSFTPTAEHTILFMLALAGDFYNTARVMKEGRWEKFGFAGTELLDKTLGIIGFGRIGQLVSQRAQAFGMKIIAYDRDGNDKSKNLQLTFPVAFVDLKTLCRQADFITIHLPKTAETIDMIGDRQLELMKKEVIIINAARGGIINEEALIKALKNNKIRAAGLDVFVSEGHDLNMDLISLPNVIATPHIAGVSSEGQRRRSVATAQNIISFFEKGDLNNLVNNYKNS